MTFNGRAIRTAPLGSLVSITGGGTPSKRVPDYFTGFIPWVTPKDMKSWFIDDAEDHITDKAISNSSASLIEPGAVLICIRSGVLAHTLPVAINRVVVALNQDMKALRCKEGLHAPYLARYLKWYSPRLLRTVRGTTAHNLSMDVIRQIEVPLPPLSDQKRIADILDKADAIRRKRREASISTSLYMHALFAELFNEGIRSCANGNIPERWVSTTIDELKASSDYSCIGGPFGSDLTASDYVPEPGIPVIRGGNLSNHEPFMSDDNLVFVSADKAEQLSKCSAFRGDVIVSQRGARLAGQVGVIPSDSAYDRYIVSQSQMKVTVDTQKLDSFFLVCYLQSPLAVREMERRTISTGVPHINLGILKSFPVCLPPRDLQDTFIRTWAAQQSVVKSMRAGAFQSDSLFNSLVQRAFKGEL